MFFVHNTSGQFKIIDSLIKSSNKSNIAFVQIIKPIKRPQLTKSSDARRFDVIKHMELIQIHTEPTETTPRLISLERHNFQTKLST